MSKSKSFFDRSTALVVMVVVFAVLLLVLASLSGKGSFRGMVSEEGIPIADDSERENFYSFTPGSRYIMDNGVGNSHQILLSSGTVGDVLPHAYWSNLVAPPHSRCDVFMAVHPGESMAGVSLGYLAYLVFLHHAGSLFPEIPLTGSFNQQEMPEDVGVGLFAGHPYWRYLGSVDNTDDYEAIVGLYTIPVRNDGSLVVGLAADAVTSYCQPL